MTFNVTILVSGKPMGGIKVACNCFSSGQTFYRFTDGNGYCGIGVPAEPQDGLLFVDDQRVVGEDKEPWKQYVTIGSTDQEVSITLIPFEHSGSVPTPSPVAWPIHRDGQVLRQADGSIFSIHGLDGFRWYVMWLRGQKAELQALIESYRRVMPGLNAARIFGMLNSFDHIYPQEWGDTFYAELRPFADWLRDTFGIGVEFTIFADAGVVMPDRNERNRHRDRVVAGLQGTTSVWLIQVANEPNKDGSDGNMPGGDQEAYEHAVAIANKGFLIDSGVSNEAGIKAGLFGPDVVGIHPPRDQEWYRRFKDVWDVWDGTKRPSYVDEGIGIAEHDKPGSRTSNADECATAAAIGHQFGVGTILHGDFGIDAKPFGPVQEECARRWHAAAMWVPPDAPLAPVWRGTGTRDGQVMPPCHWTHAPGDEPGPAEHSDDIDLRSYAKSVDSGTYLVQCHVPGQPYRSEIKPCAGWAVESAGPSTGLARMRQE